MSLLPAMSSLALKEWAVAVNAMAKGKQVMTLRKGGIHRDDKEFRVVHPEFLLFPTFEHQKSELLQETYHQDLLDSLEEDDVPGLVTLARWVQVTDVFELRAEDALERLTPHHVWTAEYAQKRLHWRPKHPLTVALLRVYQLRQPQALPILDEYDGCKSWVDLGQEVPLGYMPPVLTEQEYEEKTSSIRQAIAGRPVAALQR